MEIILKNAAGEEVTCNVLAKIPVLNREYIAYTDGTMTNDLLDLFISRCEENEKGEFQLFEIEDETEWKEVNKAIDSYFYASGGQ